MNPKSVYSHALTRDNWLQLQTAQRKETRTPKSYTRQTIYVYNKSNYGMII
jgi:hypothetical protein